MLCYAENELHKERSWGPRQAPAAIMLSAKFVAVRNSCIAKAE